MARHCQWLAKGHASTFTGTVGYVVHDRPKFVPFYLTPPSLLPGFSTDILTRETPDERNTLINSVLPFVVMAFKVSRFLTIQFVLPLISSSILHTLLQTTTFTYPSQKSGNTVTLSRCRLPTVNTPSSLLAGTPPQGCCTLVAPYAFAHRP